MQKLVSKTLYAVVTPELIEEGKFREILGKIAWIHGHKYKLRELQLREDGNFNLLADLVDQITELSPTGKSYQTEQSNN